MQVVNLAKPQPVVAVDVDALADAPVVGVAKPSRASKRIKAELQAPTAEAIVAPFQTKRIKTEAAAPAAAAAAPAGKRGSSRATATSRADAAPAEPRVVLGEHAHFLPLETEAAMRWRTGCPVDGLGALVGAWDAFAQFTTISPSYGDSWHEDTAILRKATGNLVLTERRDGLLSGQLTATGDLESLVGLFAGFHSMKRASLLVAPEVAPGGTPHASLPPLGETERIHARAFSSVSYGEDADALLQPAGCFPASVVAADAPIVTHFREGDPGFVTPASPLCAHLELLSAAVDVSALSRAIDRELLDPRSWGVIEREEEGVAHARAQPLRLRPGDLRLTIRWEQRGGHGHAGWESAYLLRKRGAPMAVGPPAAGCPPGRRSTGTGIGTPFRILKPGYVRTPMTVRTL